MAISIVNTANNTQSNAASVTVTKPGGTASGDLLLAFFSSNSQECTPPSGWTEITDEITEVFRLQVFYKLAGGSEPASYAFSVPANAPLICSIICLRGVDATDPIDINPATDSGLTHSEPYTTPSVSGGSVGRLLYFRTVRFSGTTPLTFTASGSTERVDVGVFSGGSVCYSQGLYTANSDYTSSGSQSGLAITASGAESHNVVLTLGVKASGIPGTMSVDLPSIPSASMSGSVAYPAVVDVDLPLPSMAVDVFAGSNEATLDVQVPIAASISATTPVRGTFDLSMPVLVELVGETRRFAENVVLPDREERWLVITQDGYYLGSRDVRNFPMNVDLPLLEVAFQGVTAALAGSPFDAMVQAFDATVNAPGAAEGIDTYAEVFDAEVWSGIVALPEHVSVTAATENVDQIDIGITTEPVEIVTAIEVFDASRGVGMAVAHTTVYGATISRTAQPNAETVVVMVTAGDPQFTGVATATVTANNATVAQSTQAFAGHAAATCHN